MQRDIWNLFTLPEQQYCHFEFHGCECWLKHEHNMWFVAHRISEKKGIAMHNSKAPPPADIAWEQFVVGECTTARFLPLPPNLPVVIRPQDPLNILPGEQAHFYIPLPVQIEIACDDRERSLVTELPTTTLFQTWFGERDAGELCYDLVLNLADCYAPEHYDAVSTDILCPITIANSSQTTLPFQRLCLRAVHLSVFLGSQSLWTNSVQVIFKGVEQVSQVSFSATPPAFLGRLEKLSPPRILPTPELLKRSFGFLKNFTNF